MYFKRVVEGGMTLYEVSRGFLASHLHGRELTGVWS